MNRKKDGYIGFSFIRFIFIALSFITFIVVSMLFCKGNNMMFFDAVIVLIINCVILLVFIVSLTHKRISGIFYPGTSYALIFLDFIICFTFILVSSFFPDFYMPVAVLPLLLCAAFDGTLAISFCIYFFSLYFLCFSLSGNTLIAYLLISVLSVLMGEFIKKKRKRIKFMGAIIIGLCQYILSILFIYITNKRIESIAILWLLLSAFISVIFAGIVYNFLCNLFLRERKLSYETIIDEHYPILLDIKRISQPEFNHAIKVANLSGECAESLRLDKMLSMAGGLYYHAMDAMPNIDDEKFYRQLRNRCFPPEVIRLISEKGFEGRFPTSKEGALVHMCDVLITKFEALGDKTDSSVWNTNMMVYQTLNEYSQKGFYDKCGLSMNEFLSVREILANKNYRG